ncbi:MAG: PP2C family protein-serine/threonine phosphatase [Planctomycetota bacterium]|jgi:sigma-B regulation protein RsbU (phosphoserine phosphatase)
MLPDPPVVKGFEFGCYYKPASSLGGDFYDFVTTPGGSLGIVLGDVSGHGIDAAIVMGMAKKAINIFSFGSDSPRDVLTKANASLYPDLDDMTFVSASYGVLETQSAKFSFVRAGHNPPILFSPSGNPKIRHLKPKGIVLGMQQSPVFETFCEPLEERLNTGDVLLQYTDGIVEAKNKAGEEYGLERLDQLVESNGHRGAQELADIVKDHFNEFIRGLEQDDDVTLVVLKVL